MHPSRSNIMKRALSKWPHLLLLIIATAIFAGGAVSVMTLPSSAGTSQDFTGRPWRIGYYDGLPHGDTASDNTLGWSMFIDGLPDNWQTVPADVDRFINSMRAHLYNTGDYLNAPVRASVTINTMMGIHGDDPRFNGPSATRWENGVALAKANFATWESVVRSYDNGSIPGASIEWNATEFIPDGTTDVLGVSSGITGQFLPESMWDAITATTEPVMIFHNPDGSRMTIMKICGNLTGEQTPFPSLYWQHQAQIGWTAPASVPPGSPGSPATLSPAEPGQGTLTFEGTARNSGSSTSPGGTLTGILIRTPPSGPAVSTPLASGGFGPVASGGTSSALPFSYNAVGTAEGTVLCFVVQVSPETITNPGPVSSSQMCYIVHNPRYPVVEGHSGDIHAGGNVCASTLPAGSGNINGSSSGLSYGDYVVAGSGMVSAFGSNGGATDKLTIGRTGSYSQVCRPDLVAAAIKYHAESAPPTINGVVNVANLDPASDIFYSTGGTLKLSGQFTRKVTIVALSGTIEINGNLTAPPGTYTSAQQPSLGIISAGDITIRSGTSRIDAYLFSNGTIDTCVESNSSCSPLTVNGFLMSHTLNLKRRGQAGTDGRQPGEIVNLSPQIYLNPPKLFNGISDTNRRLQGEGERAPLF